MSNVLLRHFLSDVESDSLFICALTFVASCRLYYNFHHPFVKFQLVMTLVDKGVKADAKDKYHCTPLFYAAYNKNWKLAKILAGMKAKLVI